MLSNQRNQYILSNAGEGYSGLNTLLSLHFSTLVLNSIQISNTRGNPLVFVLNSTVL